MSFTCKAFDLIIVVGTLLGKEEKATLEKLEACMSEGAKVAYLFTMEDPKFSAKCDFFSRYEVGSEEGVVALLAKNLLLHVKLPEALKAYFEALDEGYVSAESNVGEEEIEEIEALYQQAKRVLVWLGDDVLAHPRKENIVSLAQSIAKYGKAEVYTHSTVEAPELPSDVASIESFDGTVVYQYEKKEEESGVLKGSAQFQIAAKIQDGDAISLTIRHEVYACTFVRDDSLKGTVALMPMAEKVANYPYSVAKIVKADVQ